MKRILPPLLLVLLFAAPARPYWIAHTNYSLNPAVSPEQFRPAADGSRPGPGRPPLPVLMEILPLPPGFDPALREAAVRAVIRWRGLPGASVEVSLALGGKRQEGDWRSRYDREDGRNTIEFIAADWPWFFGPNIIAMTVPRLDADGRILEADIFLNAENFRWAVLPEAGWNATVVPGPDLVDTEAIVTHEMGHVFGLGHSQEVFASMYPYPGIMSPRARYLTDDDRNGLLFLYPITAADVPPASLWGFSRNNLEDGLCGSTYLSFTSAVALYVERTAPLPGPHDLISPPDWPTDPYDYCLLGAGLATGRPTTMGVLAGATLAAGATDPVVLTPNFARALLDDGSGFPLLADGTYDFSVTQLPGGTARLREGLLINPIGNQIPEAALLASRSLAAVGKRVGLDGSLSYDPDGSGLTYNFELVEAPAGATLLPAGDQAALYLPRPGIYVVRLTVDDGTVTSIADQAVIRAAVFPSGGDEAAAFGCQAASGAAGASAGLLLCLPLLVFLAARRLSRS